MRTRKKYSKEFKVEAVKLSEISGNTSQTARYPGIKAGKKRGWMQRMVVDGKRAFPGQGHSRDEEVTTLKREPARVRN